MSETNGQYIQGTEKFLSDLAPYLFKVMLKKL